MYNPIVWVICICVIAVPEWVSCKKYEPNWESLDSRPLPEWYDSSKIGVFLHWGVFSVPSFINAWFPYSWKVDHGQAYIDFMAKNYKTNFTYADFAAQFTAEFYDPDHWADIFKASGAKYVVLTTKHHEGYTLWPSKYSSNWNAMDVGPSRDLVGDLATALRKQDLKFGAYHSWMEWLHPLYMEDKANKFKTRTFVTTKSRPEREELITRYKPDLLWSDGEYESPEEYWNSTDFLAWLYNDSPVKDTIVTNDRWGLGTNCKHGGYWSCNDKYNPGVVQPHKWENAMTIDSHAWAYRREAVFADFLTPKQIMLTLMQTVSCGGNLLINAGPTHDGRITPIFEERLRQMGSWLKRNGEAIYGSKPWVHQNDTITHDVWYTTNKGYVYASVHNWPTTGRVVLGALKYSTVKSVQLLDLKDSLTFTEVKTSGSTEVTFPVLNPDSDIQWAYVLKITTK